MSVLQASHSVLCERRRNLHRTIDSLEQAGSDEPEALASLEGYKESERQISRERQTLYREIGELVQTLAVAHDDESAGGDLAAEAAVGDYAELLRCGYCVPGWASREHGLNPQEQAWVEALTQPGGEGRDQSHAHVVRDARWRLAADRNDRTSASQPFLRGPQASLQPALAATIRARLGPEARESTSTGSCRALRTGGALTTREVTSAFRKSGSDGGGRRRIGVPPFALRTAQAHTGTGSCRSYRSLPLTP